MKEKVGKSTYTWNARVMSLAKRVGDDIFARELDERGRITSINTAA